MHAWCATTKRLPSRNGDYLVNILVKDATTPTMVVATLEDGKWLLPDMWKESVSHWQRLPNPPKMESLVKHAD